MEERTAIKIFEEKKVRTVWDEENEKWFFSIIDVIDSHRKPKTEKILECFENKAQSGRQ